MSSFSPQLKILYVPEIVLMLITGTETLHHKKIIYTSFATSQYYVLTFKQWDLLVELTNYSVQPGAERCSLHGSIEL